MCDPRNYIRIYFRTCDMVYSLLARRVSDGAVSRRLELSRRLD